MKVLLCLLFVVATIVSAHAQVFATAKPLEVRRTASPLTINSIQRVQYRIPGLRMRNLGTVFTVSGIALIAGAIAVYNNGNPNRITDYNSNGSPITDQDEHHSLGAEMFFFGTSMAIPGVILWVKGAQKYNKNIYSETAIKIRPAGISISYKF
ncbi:MAG: hypothetical protein ABIS36_00070 [Chryseolinea sp.]